jgi:uncharacterized membrane protein (GlpM family)
MSFILKTVISLLVVIILVLIQKQEGMLFHGLIRLEII